MASLITRRIHDKLWITEITETFLCRIIINRSYPANIIKKKDSKKYFVSIYKIKSKKRKQK